MSAARAMTGILPKLRVAEAPSWLAVEEPQAAAAGPVAPSPEELEALVEAEVAKRRAELEAEKQRELAAARVTAEKEARSKVAAELEATKARYVEAIAAIAAATEELRTASSTRTVELGLMIAREVLGRELSFDRASLVARVEEALTIVGHEPAIKVRLGTADAAFLLARRPDLPGAGVEVVEDPSLAPGACFVESTRRMIDASLEVRLSVVREALAEVSALADEEDGLAE